MQVAQELKDDDLKRIYGKGYYNGESARVYEDYLANIPLKRAAFRARLKDLQARNYVLPPGRCLEVGCAFGLFLAEARDAGWEVVGTEISDYAAEWARRELSLKVFTDTNALDLIDSESQDLIVMWDVIEHLSEPLETLCSLRRIVAPGGLLVLSTGDVRSLGARIFGRRWYLISPPYHLFYFDTLSIERMLNAAGFVVQSVSGEGHPLENLGKYPIAQWIARNDRYLGWRLKSPPVMTIAAVPQ